MKTVMIRDDIYKKLRSIKRKNESFSDVIERLIAQADNHTKLERFFDILSEEKAEVMKREVTKIRKHLSKFLESRIDETTEKLSE